MDSRMPTGTGNEGFAGNNMFSDSQQFNAYDNLNLFQNGTDSNFSDPSWPLNAGDFPGQSRGHQPVPSWQQNANHLSAQSAQPAQHAAFNGQASPYGRSLNQSPVGFTSSSFNNNLDGQQTFPYRQPQYDPSLVTQPGNGQNFNLGIRGYNTPTPNGGTITPQALEREVQQSSFPGNPYSGNGFNSNFDLAPPSHQTQPTQRGRPVDQRALAALIPKGAESGMFSIINFESLARATNSERMTSFANVGKEPAEFDCSRMALPMVAHRRSRNEIRAAAVATGNTTVLAKIGKNSLRVKASAASPTSQQIKYEEDSSSTDDSSDDSAYSDDDDDADSPLPSKRPDDPKGGVEYDTIKALWRSKRKTLAADTIRQSLVDFWDLVKTIRDRWKADAQAVTDAESKKRMGELPLLQSRVKDQRDMIEAAFKAALKHGHRGIVELLSENVALLYLCYQFLLDRVKAEDYNGGLARAILETMGLFTTMTKDKIEKTHLVKVLPRFLKKGDVKTQFWVRKINTNAELASKEAADKPETTKSEKLAPDSAEHKTASPARKPAPEPVAGVKRAAASKASDGAAQKKVAIGTSKPGSSTATKINGVVKKPIAASEGGKPSTSTTSAGAIRKTAVAKPSGFFSNLQSASKKPGTSLADKGPNVGAKPTTTKPAGTSTAAPKPAFSFAETMANLTKPKEEKPAPKPQKDLPPETDEQRRKRLHKEQRRKLTVRFKSAEDLVDIRYFTHDPEEEIDHDSSQMRDVSDVGGEGRMFKQQSQMMDIDDDDEVEQEDLREHPTLSLIDFSVVDIEERKRMYAPYGGGQLDVESAERSIRDEYERNNLIVFYTDRSQIPPDPREPTDPHTGDQLLRPLKYFAPPDEKYALRARTKRSQNPHPSPAFGLSNPQMGASANPDIQSILASLRQTVPTQPPQPPLQQPAYMGAPGTSSFQPAPTASVIPPANIDLAAILASLNPSGTQQSNYATSGAASLGFGHTGQRQTETVAGDPDISKIRAMHPNYKTRVCRYWQDGRCQKGDSCSFLHE